MEPLVIVSAAVVLFFGYRTFKEEITEMGNDGSLDEVRDLGLALSVLSRRFSGRWARNMEYYSNFFGGVRQPIDHLSHTRRTRAMSSCARMLAKDAA